MCFTRFSLIGVVVSVMCAEGIVDLNLSSFVIVINVARTCFPSSPSFQYYAYVIISSIVIFNVCYILSSFVFVSFRLT